MSIPQKDELRAHRSANGDYVGSWTGKSGGTRTPVTHDSGNKNRGKGAYVTKAQIASMLVEHDAKKEKKANDDTLDEMRTEFSAMLQSRVNGATVAGSVATRSLKRASVGEVTAGAADAKEGVTEEADAEAAADAWL